MMNLIFIPNTTGGHLGGWRHSSSFAKTAMNLDCVVELAQIAERGKFDALFLADGNAVRDMEPPELFAANHPSARPVGFEPTTVLSAVAMMTRKIGLVATATTTYDEPWSVARRFASLDHISKGRAGWNLVTTSYAGDALNFSRDEHMPREERYSRAEEFHDVVVDLWDSWAEDAFPENKETGQFLDPARVRSIHHKGRHFKVKGPLNVARSPQGRPVIFMAGQSGPGMELAARHADALFGAGSTKQQCMDAYADTKGRMDKYGRRPEQLRIVPGISVFVGRTTEEANELFDELQGLISPALGVHYLSKLMEKDLSPYPIDGPLPEVPTETVGIDTMRRYIVDMARQGNWSIRQTYERSLFSLGAPLFRGTPQQIVDEMEDWLKSQACDGFTIMAPLAPRGLRNFVELVIPELQRRGLHRREYGSGTLRDNLGLERPANPHFSKAVAH
jgi:FMN-dependent oxidoreductase (nitrilotriacetate monooxygenase family)